MIDFKSKVRVTEDGCWLWLRQVEPSGRPILRVGNHKLSARRVVYEQHVGPIKPGWRVTNTCREKSCVAPEHLAQRTPAGITRLHWKRGTFNPAISAAANAAAHQAMGKLTWDKVREIRRRLAAGETGLSIAPEYGVTVQSISQVRLHQTWREPTGLAMLVHQVMA